MSYRQYIWSTKTNYEIKEILEHLTISRKLNVINFHGEELNKELFVEYRLKTIHFNSRLIASLARVLRIYVYGFV